MLTGPRDDAGLVRDDTRDDVEPNERFLPSPVDAGQKRLPIDMDYVQRVMVELLTIPSPSGRTDHVMQLIGGELRDLGLDFEVTRRAH